MSSADLGFGVGVGVMTTVALVRKNKSVIHVMKLMECSNVAGRKVLPLC